MLCYEERRKVSSIKTILENFVFNNKENKSKEIQGKNVLSFTKFSLGGFGLGVFVGVYVRGVFVCFFLSCHHATSPFTQK